MPWNCCTNKSKQVYAHTHTDPRYARFVLPFCVHARCILCVWLLLLVILFVARWLCLHITLRIVVRPPHVRGTWTMNTSRREANSTTQNSSLAYHRRTLGRPECVRREIISAEFRGLKYHLLQTFTSLSRDLHVEYGFTRDHCNAMTVCRPNHVQLFSCWFYLSRSLFTSWHVYDFPDVEINTLPSPRPTKNRILCSPGEFIDSRRNNNIELWRSDDFHSNENCKMKRIPNRTPSSNTRDEIIWQRKTRFVALPRSQWIFIII